MKHTVEEVKLKNGAEGLVIRVPGVEAVRILVEFRAGFDLGDWEKYELPHVMEHMMFTNKTYPKPRDFSRQVEKNGAFNNAYTSFSSLEYDYECAAFEVERMARLVGIQITEPTFPGAELKTELGNVAEELSSSISNPARTTSNNLNAAANGVPDLKKRIDQLSGITTEDLHAWYRHTHKARNMRFIVAGDIDFESKVLKYLDVGLPGGERLEIPHIKTKHLDEPVVETRDIPQIYYTALSVLERPLEYRELVAARIIASVLSDGFSSTLLGSAREKGLVYGLSMGINSNLRDSDWYIGGMVTPEHADEYFDLVNKEISKAQKSKISQRQFQATKRLMLGGRALSYQKLSNLVNYYSSYFTTGYNEFEEFNRLLDEITLEESVSTFNELFTEQRRAISFVGNIDKAKAKDLQRRIRPLWDSK